MGLLFFPWEVYVGTCYMYNTYISLDYTGLDLAVGHKFLDIGRMTQLRHCGALASETVLPFRCIIAGNDMLY